MPKPDGSERFIKRVEEILWSVPENKDHKDHDYIKTLICEAYNVHILGMSQEEAEEVEERRLQDE